MTRVEISWVICRKVQDLANGTVDTITALKRTKVLLSGLNNERLQNWINCEIAGYPNEAILPNYRVYQGCLMGSYFKGSLSQNMQWKNVPIPTGKMPTDTRKTLLDMSFREGIEVLKHLSESCSEEGRISKQIPADYYPLIAASNNDLFMIITTASVVIGTQCVSGILSAVENKLLDALIILENEFGNLDSLDLDQAIKTPEKIKEITDRIILIVYNDQSIHIGDGNRIKDSKIAQVIDKTEQ